jgi:hypothetical protein
MTFNNGKAVVIGGFDVAPQSPLRRDTVMQCWLAVNEK